MAAKASTVHNAEFSGGETVRLNDLLAYRLAGNLKEEKAMFGMLSDLTKAVVGVAVKTPLAVVADVVTMGGALTDKDEPYTVSAVKEVAKNVDNAVTPD